MKFYFADRIVEKPISEMTPRVIDTQIFYDEFCGDCLHIQTKDDDTPDWRMSGVHKYFGVFVAKWIPAERGEGFGVDGRAVVVVSEI